MPVGSPSSSCAAIHTSHRRGPALQRRSTTHWSRSGRSRRVIAVVSTHAVAALLALEDDVIALVPSVLARHLVDRHVPVRWHEIPLELPMVTVELRWHRRLDGDRPSRWLRDHIVAAASGHVPGDPNVVSLWVRIGIALDYSGGFNEAVDRIVELEKAGIDIAVVAEAYSFDAVSQLGYLAAKTNTIELASGVFPIYIRTPSLLAMTAAGLDFVSDGRFRLGIGTSGPQVMEGFHGVAFDAPIGRTREIVEICRQVWRRERVNTTASTTSCRCRRIVEPAWESLCS